LAAETNRRILPLAADVTSKEQVDRMVAEAAQQLGGLHILVNSGSAPGGSPTAIGPIDTVVDEDLIEDFNTKYVGALRCSRAVIPFMKTANWGRIINISGGNARNAGNLSGGARNAAMLSAAWWMLRRSRSSRSSWLQRRPGRSPASCCRQAAGPGARYITEPAKQTEGRVTSGGDRGWKRGAAARG
jgi:NAD(P)-dependent dehydrogenase (short-subunit alcohol dehydrogenase family)